MSIRCALKKCQFYCNKSISYTTSTVDTSLFNALSTGSGLVAVIIVIIEHEGSTFDVVIFCAYHMHLSTLQVTAQ